MKKLLIMCGAGHATSTIVRSKVEDWLKSEGLADKVTIKQSAVGNEVDNIAGGAYDIVLSTTQVPVSIQDKVINGIGLLAGMGAKPVFAELKKQIEA